MIKRRITAFWITPLLASLILGGCGDKNAAHALWQDYEQRLERVLDAKLDDEASDTQASDTEVSETQAGDTEASEEPVKERGLPTNLLTKTDEFRLTEKFRLPEKVSPTLRLEDGSGNIGILELNAIRSCRLGELIAAHNSSLGKVAQPSVWLNYQLDFIHSAPQCIASLTDGELKEKLSLTLSNKKAQARAYFIEFLNTEPVIRKALFAGQQSLDADTPLAGLSELTLALETLLFIRRTIEAGEFEALTPDKLTRLDEALRTLSRNPMLGRYIQGMNTHLTALSDLNGFLAKQDGMHCKPGHNPARQEILLNILMKYFIGKIQPYIGAYSETQFKIGRVVIELFDGTAYESQLEFYFGDDNAMAKLKQQLKEHVAIWQTLQQSCALEIKPGSAGRARSQ
ncbi:DUF3080 family protein [Shewanella sp. JM162201]|uniref:DUF3080 family protein n=1 Tax=Shewanella jiangmenensis TaxID=2837387 RepID=A0ABS5V6F0_9GAMM|nr:DUF3080 family protein [Shewanella jiangmenensis]MBT1445475.1 DUF3080 family protein [Shewanella jiangmenensis]